MGEKSNTKLQSVAQAVVCTSVDSSDKSFVFVENCQLNNLITKILLTEDSREVLL